MQDDQTKKSSTTLTRENDVPTLDQLIEEIFAWQQATFADGTEEGRIAHWQEEIKEYLADPSNGEEAVDVFFLFVAIFKHRGIDLRAEAERKLAINKARAWAKVPGGYSKHVEDEPEERGMLVGYERDAIRFLVGFAQHWASGWGGHKIDWINESAEEVNRQATLVREWLRTMENGNLADVFPDINWENIPPEHKYAWLVIDPQIRGFTWCTSQTMPKSTPQGYNGACIRVWNGNEGVRVRMDVDFRTIFRQRPEAKNE